MIKKPTFEDLRSEQKTLFQEWTNEVSDGELSKVSTFS